MHLVEEMEAVENLAINGEVSCATIIKNIPEYETKEEVLELMTFFNGDLKLVE